MKYNLIGLYICSSFALSAQVQLTRDVIASAGQVVSGTNIQMSYTIGEPFTATIQNNQIHTLGFLNKPPRLRPSQLHHAMHPTKPQSHLFREVHNPLFS